MWLASSALALATALSAQDSSTWGSPEPGVASQAAHLTWDAPALCPRRDKVVARIEGLLGRPFAESGIRAEVIVRVRGEDSWSLVLTTWHDDLTDERALEAQSCETLVNALALLLSVIEDPLEVSTALGVEAHVSATQPSVGGSNTDQRVAVTSDILETTGAPLEHSAPDRRGPTVLEDKDEGFIAERSPEGTISPAEPPARLVPPLLWSLRAAGGAEIGALPTASGGLSGAIVVGRARGQLELSGLYVFPRTGAIEGISGASARVQLGAVGLRGCGIPVSGKFALVLCTGLEAGVLEGSGEGTLDSSSRELFLWLGALVGPSLRWNFTRLASLWVGLDLVVPIVAPRFTIELPEKQKLLAHEVAPATGRLLVGLEFALRRGASRKITTK